MTQKNVGSVKDWVSLWLRVKEHRVKKTEVQRRPKQRRKRKASGKHRGWEKKAQRALCSQTGSNDAISITDSTVQEPPVVLECTRKKDVSLAVLYLDTAFLTLKQKEQSRTDKSLHITHKTCRNPFKKMSLFLLNIVFSAPSAILMSGF